MNHDGMAGEMTTRGWSMFEAIAMSEAMGIDAAITLKSTETYADLGDLVLLRVQQTACRPSTGMRAAVQHASPACDE